MTKISLCIIAKNEEKNIKECLDSIQSHVDEICITDTGSTDKTISVIESLPYAHKIKISYFTPKTNPEAFFEDGAIYSFCKARNFSFSQATGDWVLWMDCDDVFRFPERLPEIIKVADENKIDGYFFRYHYLIQANKVIEQHWKLQLIKKDAPIQWKGNIHEDLLTDGQVKLAKTEAIVRVHKNGVVDSPEKGARNLRILLRDLQEQGDKPDPRTLFYTARAFLVADDEEAAQPLLEKYIEISGWPEETYEALHLLSDIYYSQKKYKLVVETNLSALDIRPDFPEAYFNLARAYIAMNDYKRAEEWLKKGFATPPSQESVTHFQDRYTIFPLSLLSQVQLYTGRLDDALATAKKAVSYAPANKQLLEMQSMLEYLKKRHDVAKAYVQIAGYLRERKMEWKIPTLLGTVSEDMNADPLISRIRSQWCPPKKWAKDSVVILAFGAVEGWSPKNEKEGGIGGSEEAVLNLSRELAKMGYDVTVFTNTGADDGDYEGVHWKMFTEFNGQDEFDTLVIWRQPSLMDTKFNAKTILFDMHDVPYYGDWKKERQDNVKKIMVKSQYHRSLLPEVPDDKIVVVGNGITLSHFKGTQTREPNRCIYSSAIDRGLDILLDRWPEVRKEVPDATLHIYYGFKTFEELQRHNPERMAYLQKIKDKLAALESEGVVYHGRVDHETLAKEFKKSDLWLYPTYFPEIHCITALKAQKGGAIPVCTDYAALDETVQNGVKIKGDIYLPEVQDEFFQETIKLLKDPARKESIRATMHEWADKNSWTEVAKVWDKTIRE